MTTTSTTNGPVRKPDGTGKVHNRLGGDTRATQYLACGNWNDPAYKRVTADQIRDGDRCRRCWPGETGGASSSGRGEVR